jgi:hypothetical protein
MTFVPDAGAWETACEIAYRTLHRIPGVDPASITSVEPWGATAAGYEWRAHAETTSGQVYVAIIDKH